VRFLHDEPGQHGETAKAEEGDDRPRVEAGPGGGVLVVLVAATGDGVPSARSFHPPGILGGHSGPSSSSVRGASVPSTARTIDGTARRGSVMAGVRGLQVHDSERPWARVPTPAPSDRDCDDDATASGRLRMRAAGPAWDRLRGTARAGGERMRRPG